MTSTLSKLADKNFVVGFLLPALLAAVAMTLIFPDLGILDSLRQKGWNDKTLADFAYLGLAVYSLALGFMISNYIMYRLLEGYLPPYLGWRVFEKSIGGEHVAWLPNTGTFEESGIMLPLFSGTRHRR
jgi:hypothetical protein